MIKSNSFSDIHNPLEEQGPASNDIVYYFLPSRQQGAIWSSGLLKLNYFLHKQGKDALPSKAAFLLQCPYLVNCSELAAQDHREQEKGSCSP